MPIYQPRSKNIVTLTTAASVALVSYIVALILFQTGHGPNHIDSNNTNMYVTALFPLIFGGLPLLLMSSFIFGVFALGREDDRVGRWQAVILLLILLIIGYLTSFLLFSNNI